MLKSAPLEIVRPGSRAELDAAISARADDFKLLAGGTDLVNGLKKRLYPESVLISLKRVLALRDITYDQNSDQLTIGSMTTLSQLAADINIAIHQPAIAAAANLIAAPPIRNRATVGGNICLDTRCYYYNQSQSWRQLAAPCFKCGGKQCNAAPGAKTCRAVFSADLPPLLIALETKLSISNGTAERELPLQEFYTGDGAAPTILQKNEYITKLTINSLKAKASIYKKFRLRKALDFPLAGVALTFDQNRFGKFINPTIILNAVASGPLAVSEAATLLEDKSFSDEKALTAAAEALSRAARPIANIGSKPFYRKKMVGLLLKKMALELAAAEEA